MRVVMWVGILYLNDWAPEFEIEKARKARSPYVRIIKVGKKPIGIGYKIKDIDCRNESWGCINIEKIESVRPKVIQTLDRLGIPHSFPNLQVFYAVTKT